MESTSNSRTTSCTCLICVQWAPSVDEARLMFLLHGYWKYLISGTASPSDLSEMEEMPLELQIQLRRFMPNTLGDDGDGDDTWELHRTFWDYEWQKHGRAMCDSATHYFDLTMNLFSRIPQLRDMGIQAGTGIQVGEFIQRAEASVKIKEPAAVARPRVSAYHPKSKKSNRKNMQKLQIFDCQYHFDDNHQFVKAPEDFSGDIDGLSDVIEIPIKPSRLVHGYEM